MSDAKINQYPGTLYDYNAGVYCGVLVSAQVMRKLAALQAMHVEAVKRLLTDNKTEVFPSMWTLHYPNGEQKIVRFIDRSEPVERAIDRATHSHQPRAVFPVFIASSMDEAGRMADERHDSQQSAQEAGE